VHAPNTDIDALCVAPRHVDREIHFFGGTPPSQKEKEGREKYPNSSLPKLLSDTPGVKNLNCVQEAYVPRIGMEFEGIEIDLVFARVEAKEVGDDLQNLLNDSILKNCDPQSVRSLNGSRVADIVLEKVPDKEKFSTTLRCIKLWAKSRGIYSNVLGYFGGVSWMILVANICMTWPCLETNKLLKNFFEFYSKYPWNYQNPIMLLEVEHDVKYGIDKDLLYKENPMQLMPILTPAYPSMNSTHNVSVSTKSAILTELQKGLQITEALLKRDEKGNKVHPTLSWRRLFKKFNFFGAYPHFVMITVLAKTDDLQNRWLGFAESKIRHFIQKKLEFLSKEYDGSFLELEFRPWSKTYKIASTMKS